MAGHAVGRYELLRQLGQGGMATVYTAFDPHFERQVAIKILPREFLHDRTFHTRFQLEARTIAALEHSAIVPVYDFGEHNGQPYLVMRLMTGGSLADYVQQGPLPLDSALRIIDRVAFALDRAHNQGIIHRDVKPANILFDDVGEAYLSDFGIVKLTESTAHLTGSGIVGTPAYLAPEMIDKGGTTHLIDIYALGVTLFQMLTGEMPYDADTPMGVLLAHLGKPVPEIHSLRPDLPAGMQSVIDLAMAKKPEERYQSARQLAADFRDQCGFVVDTVRAEAASPSPPTPALPLDVTQPESEAFASPTLPASAVSADPVEEMPRPEPVDVATEPDDGQTSGGRRDEPIPPARGIRRLPAGLLAVLAVVVAGAIVTVLFLTGVLGERAALDPADEESATDEPALETNTTSSTTITGGETDDSAARSATPEQGAVEQPSPQPLYTLRFHLTSTSDWANARIISNNMEFSMSRTTLEGDPPEAHVDTISWGGRDNVRQMVLIQDESTAQAGHEIGMTALLKIEEIVSMDDRVIIELTKGCIGSMQLDIYDMAGSTDEPVLTMAYADCEKLSDSYPISDLVLEPLP